MAWASRAMQDALLFDLDPNGLAKVAWALGTLGLECDPAAQNFMRTAVSACLEQMHALSPQGVSNLSFAVETFEIVLPDVAAQYNDIMVAAARL